MKFIRRSGVLHWLRYNLLSPPRGGLLLSRGDWRVFYPPNEIDQQGGFSIEMTYGTACDYAELFGGEVIRAKDMP